MRSDWRVWTLALVAAIVGCLLLIPIDFAERRQGVTGSSPVTTSEPALKGRAVVPRPAPRLTGDRVQPGLRVVVRDVRTHAPVEGFVALVRDRNRNTTLQPTVVSGPGGVLVLPSGGLRNLRVSKESAWVLVGSAAPAATSPQLWVYEKVGVRVRVHFDPPDQAPARKQEGKVPGRKTQTRIDFELMQPIDGIRTPSPKTGDRRWLWRHGLGRIQSRPQALKPSGSEYELFAPRLPGYALAVHVEGWITPRVDLDCEGASLASPLQVTAVLKRATVIGGVLRDESGKPVSGATIMLRTVSVGEVGQAEFEFAQLQMFAGSGPTMLTDRRTRKSAIHTRQRVRTNGRGEYKLGLPLSSHRAELHVMLADRPPLLRDLGIVTADITDADLTAPPRASTAGSVVLRLGGKNLSGGTLMATDVSGTIHRSWQKEIGADGRVTTEWFEPGRGYNLMIVGARKKDEVVSGYVKWDGTETLDVDKLPDWEEE